MKFIFEIAFSIWLTSSLFMLGFWFIAFFTTWQRDKKILTMPLGSFLYLHFCPIVHTAKCFQIMRRYTELKSAQKERRGV